MNTLDNKENLCPKCGAGREKNLYNRFDCESYVEVRGYTQPLLPFVQSDQCRIRELKKLLLEIKEWLDLEDYARHCENPAGFLVGICEICRMRDKITAATT